MAAWKEKIQSLIQGLIEPGLAIGILFIIYAVASSIPVSKKWLLENNSDEVEENIYGTFPLEVCNLNTDECYEVIAEVNGGVLEEIVFNNGRSISGDEIWDWYVPEFSDEALSAGVDRWSENN